MMLTKEDIINIKQNIECITTQLNDISSSLKREPKDTVIDNLICIENIVSSLIIELSRTNKESIKKGKK